MSGRRLLSAKAKYGFNGKLKDNEDYGEGNAYDFGARIYDSRLGKWLSVDPKASKYANLSPYNFTGNNPTLFVDYDGKDFGIKIDYEAKTIVVVSNIYTTSSQTYQQAASAASVWNAKSANIDGYSVSFKVNVIQPSKSLYSTEQLKSKELRNNAAWNDSEDDNIGNVFAGLDGHNSSNVKGETFVGGVTEGGKHISMKNHDIFGDMGNRKDIVAHEIGHTFGLDDIGDPYYGGKNGIMEYSGIKLKPISDKDVRTILNYAKDALSGKDAMSGRVKEGDAKVTILERKGTSDGNNPVGVPSARKSKVTVEEP